MKIVLILFVAMVVAIIGVQVITRCLAQRRSAIELQKGLKRMTDDWLKVCYQNAKQKEWKGVSRRTRKLYEAEIKLRKIKV